MRLPLSSWKQTLSRLGLKLQDGPVKPNRRGPRPVRLETLEVRDLLAADIQVLLNGSLPGYDNFLDSDDISIDSVGAYISLTIQNTSTNNETFQFMELYASDSDSNTKLVVDQIPGISPEGEHVTYQLDAGKSLDAKLYFSATSNFVTGMYFEGEDSGHVTIASSAFNVAYTAPTGPEIVVTQDGLNIELDDLFSFGHIEPGVTVSKTFVVHNVGAMNLTLGTLHVPSGYSVTNGLVSTLAPGQDDEITIRFNGSDEAGEFKGLVYFDTNDATEDPFEFDIETSVDGPEIKVFYGTQEFQTYQPTGPNTYFKLYGAEVGEVVYRTFRIENSGNETLILGNISVPSPLVLSTGLSSTSLESGQSATFTVKTNVTDGGYFGGKIVIENNDDDESPFEIPTDVRCSAPEVALYDDSAPLPHIPVGGTLSLGNVNFGDPITKELRVANVGYATSSEFFLTLGDITVSNGLRVSRDFALTTLGAQSTYFAIEFNPTTLGAYSGTLSFENNDANENPYTINVTANVIAAPEIDVFDVANGNTLLVDDKSQVTIGTTTGSNPAHKTFRIENNGYSNLTIGTVYSTSASFVISKQPSLSTLTPGGSTTFEVTLPNGEPSSLLSSEIHFTTNDDDENPFSFDVKGTISGPKMNVTDVTTGDNITFQSGEVDFGATPLGYPISREIKVSNVGGQILNLEDIDVPAGFVISSDFNITSVPAYTGYAYFTLELVADAFGTYSGDVSFGNNTFAEDPFVFHVTGTVEGAEIDLFDEATGGLPIADDSGEVDFGDTKIGTPISRTLRVENNGNVPLTLDTINITGDFTLTSDFGTSTVDPGKSTTFTLEMGAAAFGKTVGTISFGNNDNGEDPYNFSITGFVDGIPEIEVYDDEVSGSEIPDGKLDFAFGSVDVGGVLPRKFRVENTGTGYLTLDPLSVPSGYTITQVFGESKIAPGDDTVFEITLDATTPGKYDGEISFTTNDSDETPFDFYVTGYVIAPALSIAIAESKNTAIENGENGKITVTRTSSGSLENAPPLTFSLSLGGDADSSDYSLNPTTYEIPAGEDSVTIEIKATNDALWEEQETLSITIAESSSGQYSIDTGNDTVNVYIQDNDLWEVGVTKDGDAKEAGPTPASFIFTRQQSGETDTSNPLTIDFWLDTEATLGEDFSLSSSVSKEFDPQQQKDRYKGQIVIPANESEILLTVSPTDDEVTEGDVISVSIIAKDPEESKNQPNYYVVADVDDDSMTDDSESMLIVDNMMTRVWITPPSGSVKEGETTGLVVHRSEAGKDNPLTVYVDLVDVEATFGLDYSASGDSQSNTVLTGQKLEVTFAADETEVALTFSANVDQETESNESAKLMVVEDTSGTPTYSIRPGQDTATITITDSKYVHVVDDVPDECECTCMGSSCSVSLNQGGVKATEPGQNVQYQNPTPTQTALAIDYPFDASVTNATSIEVRSSFQGQVRSTFYNSAGMVAGEDYRISVPINTAGLATGSYDWSMEVIEHYAGGTPDKVDSFSGTKKITNYNSPELSQNWRQQDSERLFVKAGRILWQRNGGTYEFLPDANGDFSRPEGEYGFTVITEVTGQAWKYVITMASGDQYRFNDAGLLIEAESRVGNKTTYTYKAGTTSIESITDYRDRTKTFQYNLDGRLESVTDFTGVTTTYAYEVVSVSGVPTTVLSKVRQTDPAGANPTDVLETTYNYDSLGRLQSIDSPNGGETLSYDSLGYVDQITHNGGGETTYKPWVTAGLVDSAAGIIGTESQPATLMKTKDIYAEITEKVSDTQSVTRKMQYDEFGRVIREIDGEGNVTTYDRVETETGRTITVTQPDPDGPGSNNEVSYVTVYEYDTHGNLLKITHPDQTTESWEYDLTFNEATKYIDQRGAITLYTLDSTTGRTLTERLIVGENDLASSEQNDLVTTYTYTPQPSLPLDAPAGLIDLMTFVSAAGNRITDYDYDKDGNVTKITYAKGTAVEASVSYEYTPEGYLAKATDEIGDETQYVYDDLGRQVEVIMPDPDDSGPLSSPVMRYVYDSKGLVVETIETDLANSVSRSVQYVYDHHGRVLEEKRPDHDGDGKLSSTYYDYFENGWLHSVTDAEGRVTTYGYDDDGRVISVTLPDPDGNGLNLPTYSYAYDAMGRQTVQVDPLGHITATGYGDWGRAVYTAEGTLLADPDGMTFFREYAAATTDSAQLNAFFRQLGKGSGTLRLSSNYYDSTGQYLHDGYEFQESSGLSLVLFTSVNNGDPASVARPTSTIYEYDELGRVSRMLSPEYTFEGQTRRSETIYEYNGFGELAYIHETADGVTRTTEYQYDARGRQIAVIYPNPDGSQPQQTFAYDDAGRLVSETISGILPGDATPTSYTTSYTYDHLGRVVATTMPDPGSGSPVYLTQYDAFGRVIVETDPLQNATQYEYDLHDNLIGVLTADPDDTGPELALRTSMTYNEIGWTLSTTVGPDETSSPQARVTTYEYDRAGRTTKVTYPDPDPLTPGSPIEVNYVYDLLGRLLSQADANGNVTSYAYDVYNQMTSMTTPDPDGVGPEVARVYNFSYDARGRTTFGYDAQGRRVYYVYDGRNNLLEERQTVDPDTTDGIPAPSMLYVYDGFGRMVSMTDPVGNETQYVFDTLDRMTSMINAEQGVSQYTYDFRGNRLTLSDPEANVTTWAYDALGRVVSETNPLSAVRSYQYDVASNLTQYVDRNGRVSTYSYDQRNRLRDENWYASQGGSLVDHLQFDYDSFGQLTSASDSDSTLSIAYDNLGRQVDVGQTHGGKSYNVEQTYDSVGNRLTYDATFDSVADAQRDFTYDGRNRLVSVQESGVSVDKRVDFSYNTNNQFMSIERFEDLNASDLAMQSTYSYDALLRLTQLLTTGSDSKDLPQIPPEVAATTLTITAPHSTSSLIDNVMTLDFGAFAETHSRTQVFVVTNTGANDLHLGDISLPTGYSLAKDFDVEVLAPGEYVTFAVRFDAASAGTFAGNISFDTNGAVDGTFNFAVTFEVLPIVSTIIVNSTRDLTDSNSGDGTAWTGQNNSAGTPEVTLRAAIEYANATPGVQEILFAIPQSEAGWNGSWWAINVASALPAITDIVLIRGESQDPLAAGNTIEIHSTSMSSFSGLSFDSGASDSLVSWLTFTNFVDAGISIAADRVHIYGTYIAASGGAGIRVSSGNGNVIGTDGDGINDAAERNLISNNVGNGIEITGTSSNNRVAGNYIGVTADGSAAASNANGVVISGSATHNYVGTDGDGFHDAVEGNLISGNVTHGVRLTGAGVTDNRVAGNRVGTNAAGTAAIANVNGIVAISGASSNIIGTDGDGIADEAEVNLISGNSDGGVVFASSASYNRLAGNLIGVNATATAALANGHGVRIGGGAHHNLIGTNSDGVNDALESNLISGNTTTGLIIQDSGTTANQVAGNKIGTNLTGQAAIANIQHGVVIYLSATGNLIGTNGNGVGDAVEGNLISGNGGAGVVLSGSGITGNRVAGNIIGANAEGTNALANGSSGVIVTAGAASNIIGTNGDGVSDGVEGNLISGNAQSGIEVIGSSNSNRISGNRIGTNAAGNGTLGNVVYGVAITNSSNNNLVGTNSDGVGDQFEGNVISGNHNTGVVISGTVTGNVVAGNMIGSSADGALNLGNWNYGVVIGNNADNNRVGSNMDGVRDAAEGNIIAYNGGDGITVVDSTSIGNSLRRNQIFRNGNLAIDLANNGVTSNDTFDWDSGPNGLQNFPTISSISSSQVSGSISSTGNRTFYIDLYGGYRPGEANAYLGSVAVGTSFFGSANYTINANLYDYSYFVVTATDSSNNNTSEFSAVFGNSPVINTGSGNAYSHDTIAWDSSSPTKSLTLANYGSSAFTVSSVTVDNPNFTLASVLTGSYGASATDAFTVTAAAGLVQDQTGTLTITLSTGKTFVYNLRYNAPDSEIALTLDGNELAVDAEIDFGQPQEGNYVTKTLVINNPSANPLYLSNFAITGDFILLGADGLTSIAAGQSANIQVQFASVHPGAYSGELSFTTSDEDETSFLISLTGTIVGNGDGQSLLDQHDYQYDYADRLTGWDSFVFGNQNFTYDDTNQLTDIDRDGADQSFTYDDNGNRISGAYVIGPNNQILSNGVYNYQYDAEGNRIRRTEIATGAYVLYSWDHRNRLIGITEKDSLDATLKTVAYAYDIFGRRIAKEIDANGDGDLIDAGDSEERYYYDGLQIALRTDGDGTILNRYLYGPSIDQIIADEDAVAGDVLWAATDHLGSIRHLVDYDDVTKDVTIANSIDYDAFGNIVSETNAAIDHIYAYTGRDRDQESDLQYNRARMFDAAIGRWISEDPIGFSAGDANLYRYVGNAPGDAIDPDGTIIIFVHGINSFNSSHAKILSDSINTSHTTTWGHPEQAFLHFKYGTQFKGRSPTSITRRYPPNMMDANNDTWSQTNVAAGKALAELLDFHWKQRERLCSNEKITLIAYSNGAVSAYLALAVYGAKVDNLILLGGSLDQDTDFSLLNNSASNIINYWSDADREVTGWVDGIGGKGIPGGSGSFNPEGADVKNGWDNIFNQYVSNVYHSDGTTPFTVETASETRVNGVVDGVSINATKWLSAYLAKKFYSEDTLNFGDNKCSKDGLVGPNDKQKLDQGFNEYERYR